MILPCGGILGLDSYKIWVLDGIGIKADYLVFMSILILDLSDQYVVVTDR